MVSEFENKQSHWWISVNGFDKIVRLFPRYITSVLFEGGFTYSAVNQLLPLSFRRMLLFRIANKYEQVSLFQHISPVICKDSYKDCTIFNIRLKFHGNTMKDRLENLSPKEYTKNWWQRETFSHPSNMPVWMDSILRMWRYNKKLNMNLKVVQMHNFKLLYCARHITSKHIFFYYFGNVLPNLFLQYWDNGVIFKA